MTGTENGSEVEFLSKFFLSFYYKALDLPDKLYLQVFWRDKISFEDLRYTIETFELEVLQELVPLEIRVMEI